jgi:siroheme synthase-like protein
MTASIGWTPSMTPMYPAFLKVEGRACLVVGGGPIAAQKTRELVECGGHVDVVSPTLDPAFDGFRDQGPGTLQWHAREFSRTDADNRFLVLSATGDPAVDNVVYEEAVARGTLVNVVDVPDRCDWYAGAVVRSGPVTVCMGTNGASPSLAIALRTRIEQLLTPSVGRLARALGEARPDLKRAWPDYAERAKRLNRVIDAAFDRVDDLDADDVRTLIAAVCDCDRSCEAGTPCCALDALESP